MQFAGKGRICSVSAVAAALALAGAAGSANAFVASYSVTGYSGPGIPDFFSLPQYSGPGAITSVTLAISGSVGGVDYFPYDIEEGISIPSSPASWDVLLQGPGDSYPLALVASVSTEFIGGTIPPCTEPGCMGMAYAYFGPLTASFSASGAATDLSDFAGAGSNDFLVFNEGGYDNNYLSVTVTETIATAGTPEPSAWVMMLIGLGAAGVSMRRRVRRTGAPAL